MANSEIPESKAREAVAEPSSKEVAGPHRLFRSTSIVSGMTLISRILGFIRDMVCAQVFGAGGAFDAFVIAFKIPNFFRRLFAEGAFSQAFVPVMSEYRYKRAHEDAQEFIRHIAGALGLALTLVVVLAEIISPVIVMIFAPGFFFHDVIRFQLASHMLRITFPYLFLIGITAFGGAILNTCGRFAIPAFSPVLLNLSMILVAWFWAPHASVPIYVLAWGVIFGGVAQLLIQLPFLRKQDFLVKPKISFKDPGVKRVLKLMIPALFGVSVAQLSLLIDNFFASFLPKGSISWLYYSDRLTYLPLGIIGVALATVVMPYLSRAHSTDSRKQYSETLDWSLRCALLIGLPSAVGLFVLAGPTLATLFQHGTFNDFDVIMSSESLMAFAVGLPSFMLVKILASAFYSRQNIKTPVKVAVIAVVCNLILNVILIFPLKHAGLALATSLASWVNSGLLLFLLFRKKIFEAQPKWLWLIFRILVANVAMGIFIWWLAGGLPHWLAWDKLKRFLHLGEVIGGGIGMYLFSLFLMGVSWRNFQPPKEI